MISDEAKKLLIVACIVELGNRYYESLSLARKYQFITTASKLADLTELVNVMPKNVQIAVKDMPDMAEKFVVLPSPKDEGLDDAMWLLKYRAHIRYTDKSLKPLHDLPLAFEEVWKALNRVLRGASDEVSAIIVFCTNTLMRHTDFAEELSLALKQ